jgi:quinol monooxygenase YgiN
MYGTVARMRATSGSQELLAQLAEQMHSDPPPGMVAALFYRMDADPDEYIIAVAFESREAYWANAQSEDQDRRYRQLRELLASDPEWHDGEIVRADGLAATPSEAPPARPPA